MSIPIQINNKTFLCKKKFIRNNPSFNDFLQNGTYIINLDDVDIEPCQDILTRIFLNQHYLISESNIDFLTLLNKKIKCIDLQIKINKFGSKDKKNVENIINHPDLLSLSQLEDLLLDLREGNFNSACSSIESMITEKKINIITLIRTVFGSLFPCLDKIDLYLNLITRIDHTIEIKREFCSKIVEFCEKSKNMYNREMCFIINKLVEKGFMEYNGFNKHNPFFMHYMSEEEINKLCRSRSSKKLYLPEIKGDNFHQHRIWCNQGSNEHKIAEFIRKDDLEQIKKNNFNFDTYNHLPPSIYECHEIFGVRAKHVEYAALYGAEKCFDYFIENINYATTNDKLARCAIIGGNNNIIKKCIEMKLMTQNCLETALIYHRNELFELLLGQKKSFSISPNFYHISLYHGCFKAIQIMIRHGSSYSSFLYHAVTHENVSLFRWLLLLDPEVNFKGGLMILKAIEKCHYDILKLLVKYPSSDFNCSDKFNGSTCLHFACKFHDDVRVVKMVLERMKEEMIVAKTKDGYTALHNACIKGNVDVVKLLMETNFFNIDEVTKKGLNSLHLAASNKHAEIVRYFLSCHPEKVRPLLNQKIVQLCYDLLNVSVTDMLYEMVKIPPGKNTLSNACLANAVEYATYLFSMMQKEKWQFECSNKDFILACKNGFSQIALLMIGNSVLIVPNEIMDGKTSLHYACKNGMEEVVNFLINHDFIDLNLRAKRSKRGQKRSNEEEPRFTYQEDEEDFSYDTEYDIEEEEDQPENKGENKAENKGEIQGEIKIVKKNSRKERREKLREFLKKSNVDLKEKFDKDTEDYIYNEEDDDDVLDKRKFDNFISEVRARRPGRSAISIACRHGHLGIVKSLLSTNRVDFRGVNLLFDSICSGSKELVAFVFEFMLDHNKIVGSSKLSFSTRDETPLQFVCRVSDDLEIVRLIFHYFPPRMSEEEFNSYYYSEFQKCNDDSFYSSQIEVFNNNFEFDYYCNENLNSLFKIAIENGHQKTARFILDKIIQLNDSQFLNDCLFSACKVPCKEIMRIILRSPGMSKLFEIENLEEVIFEVCKKGRIDNLKVIFKELELDVVNMIFHQTKNILHLASESPNPEILEYIIAMNNVSIDMDLNGPDGNGYTALMLAAKKKNFRNTEILFFNNEINRSIVAHKKSIYSLCYCTGSLCFVDLLRQVKSFSPKDEKLILHSVCESGNVELFQWIIDNKIISMEEMIKYQTKEGFSCFHTAVLNGRIKMIDKLIQLGLFDVNNRANDGRTPLQIAVDSNDVKTVEFLLSSNLTAVNSPYPKKRQTVLHKAVKERLYSIVCLLLLNQKVDLNAKDVKGRTPEEICNSKRIQKMFIIKKSEEDEEVKIQKLRGLFDSIQKAEKIKEKFYNFLKLNRKIRFDYHITSYEFDDPNLSIPSALRNDGCMNYCCDPSSLSDDDEDENLEDADNEVAFLKKNNNGTKNKRSRARYRNRKKYQKKKNINIS